MWLQPLSRTLLLPVASALAIVGAALPGAADPRAEVEVSPAPEGQGATFPTGVIGIESVGRHTVEEEFFVRGEVDVFRYGSPPVRGELFLRSDVPTAYTTRMVVRRPSAPWRFRGTLVVEWFNSTAGFDSAPAWDLSADYFARHGIVYVGVSVSPAAVGFLRGGCQFLGLTDCGTRYTALSLPEPGQAFEMMSQIVTLLRSDRPENPLPRGFRVQRVFHVGQSQQAADVTLYAREFHFEGNDGYFLQAGLGGSKAPSSGSPNIPTTAPEGLAPTDLPVPVVRAQTETDLVVLGARNTRQVGQDAENFRYYEIAGMTHNTTGSVEVFPAGAIGPDPVRLEDLCLAPSNTGGDGPVFGRYVYNAIWRNLELQARYGVAQPLAEPLVLVGGVIQRDAFGNALGGIRLPDIEVPTASYAPSNLAKPACGPGQQFPACLPPQIPPLIGLACLLSGSVTPFPPETLDDLYRSELGYRLHVLFASLQLRRQGFLLLHDQAELLRRALAVEIP